jgi:formate-dependent nitrite reductase membrane component NrfD
MRRLRLKPALGTPGGPARWLRARDGAGVEAHEQGFRDGAWSFLYGEDTEYAVERRDGDAAVAEAARKARTGPTPEVVQGPMMKPAVWTWEVPLYFWTGGIAAGAGFVGLACDLAGDKASAATARKVALGAVAPSPLLLISDLGRPERFYNMLRIVKPRSPMSMGAWALTVYGNLIAAAVGADLLGRGREARAAGAVAAVVGGYLGSYTGVLLGSTAVPVWSRSRLFLGPIFVATATATGAAACRLALVATGMPQGHPTRIALGRVETGAIATELALSTINERRLGRLAAALEEGPAGKVFRGAKWGVRAGLALRLLRRRGGPWTHHMASGLYLGAGLAFRYAWVAAGRHSARDDRVVAETARSRSKIEAGRD